MTPLFISFKVVGGDKWVMSKLRQTTILRPFFDIFERLPNTQNFFLLKNYPPALQKPFLKIQRVPPLDVEIFFAQNHFSTKAKG